MISLFTSLIIEVMFISSKTNAHTFYQMALLVGAISQHLPKISEYTNLSASSASQVKY